MDRQVRRAGPRPVPRSLSRWAPYVATAASTARNAYSAGRRLGVGVRRLYNSYNSTRSNSFNGYNNSAPTVERSQRRLGVKRKCKVAPKFRKKVQCIINENRPQGRDVFWTDNTAINIVPNVTRPTAVKTWAFYPLIQYFNVQVELEQLWPGAAVAAVKEAILKETIFIPYWQETKEFRNEGQCDVTMKFYEIVPVSTTTENPTAAMNVALTKIRGSVDMVKEDEGVTPYMLPSFKQKWKIVKTKSVVVKPGRTCFYSQIKRNTHLNNNYVDLGTSSTYTKNYTTLLLVSIQASNETAGANLAPYNNYRIVSRQHRDIKIQCPNAIPDAETIEVLRTGRLSAGYFAGAGPGEIKKIDPKNITLQCNVFGPNTRIEDGS